MFKRRIITTTTLGLLTIIGSIVDRFTGFAKGYFAIAFASVLAGYWMFEFLIDLIYYSYDCEEEFKIYVAEKVNKTTLSYEEIMQNKKYYLKEFKRKRRGGKFLQYVKLFFCMGLFIFLVTCLF